MPTYEYRCKKCGKQFEKVQKMSDEAVADCPACKSSETQRLISNSSFVLKGSGWYASDYGNQKSEPAPQPSCCCGSGNCKA